MKKFLDSSVLVEACLAQSPKFAEADRLVGEGGAVTSAHALAEAYAVLSGSPRLKIKAEEAARMVEEMADTLSIRGFEERDYRRLIAEAPRKGVRGGSLYDALHAETARLAGCDEIHTLNANHFRHVAPDLTVVAL